MPSVARFISEALYDLRNNATTVRVRNGVEKDVISNSAGSLGLL